MEPRKGAAFDPPARFERAGGFQFVGVWRLTAPVGQEARAPFAPCAFRTRGRFQERCPVPLLDDMPLSTYLWAADHP